MASNIEYIAIFQSHNQAIYIYKYLINKGYKVELVTTPCDLSAGCSQSLKFKEEFMNQIIKEINNNSIKINGIYKIIKQGKNLSYEKV